MLPPLSRAASPARGAVQAGRPLAFSSVTAAGELLWASTASPTGTRVSMFGTARLQCLPLSASTDTTQAVLVSNPSVSTKQIRPGSGAVGGGHNSGGEA